MSLRPAAAALARARRPTRRYAPWTPSSPLRIVPRLPTNPRAFAVLLIASAALWFTTPAHALTRSRARSSCSKAATHAARTARASHACTKDKRNSKAKSHRKKKAAKGHAHSAPATVPATCEDGRTPTSAGHGTFACADGSEPECEAGATPVRAPNGAGLVCPVAPEPEEEAEPEEAECEEGVGLACGGDSALGSSERVCLATPGPGGGFVCEDER
jgi:hypothetical protein